ncbi:hypothetical protein [Companilactobacillus nantensis]|uniref:Uncharacterized protein n=2 Tax=Companilactobacillus nantensis TaxID=305793 RepID=A0A0R1WKX9_9LACO|nr:hypothetical protein [Companilactobacillus nantensis]KRM18455.1 hypothetical protein FD31_GL001002 [Companilactobacillus nantensis DSM 16982]
MPNGDIIMIKIQNYYLSDDSTDVYSSIVWISTKEICSIESSSEYENLMIIIMTSGVEYFVERITAEKLLEALQ